MDFFNLGSYQFRYYICRNIPNGSLSVCFVPSPETETQLTQESEKPQKITYELYERLEDLLGNWMSFSPLFNKELSLFEIQVTPERMNMTDASFNIRKTFQNLK